MPNYRLLIAKSGHHITDGDRYLIVNTKYPTLKLFQSGTGTLNTTAGSGGGSVEITHSLGFKPLVYVYGNWIDYGGSSVNSKYALWNRFIYQGLQESDLYYYSPDTTKLYINVQLSTLTDINNYAFNYMYHIFYDEDTL